MSKPVDFYTMAQTVYDLANEQLFNGCLPDPFWKVENSRRAAGHFASRRFLNKRDVEGTATHEIMLNLAYHKGDFTEFVDTLLHEMCHLWRTEVLGDTQNGYHCKSWGRKMVEIGLQPIDVITGQEILSGSNGRVGDKIIPGGPADLFIKGLICEGFTLDWQENAPPDKARALKKKKVGYTCPNCGETKVWGKPGLLVACAPCSHEDTLQLLEEKHQDFRGKVS